MTPCPGPDQLGRILSGTVDPVLEEHVAGCPACQGVLEKLAAADAPVGRTDYRVTADPADATFLERLRDLPLGRARGIDSTPCDGPTGPLPTAPLTEVGWDREGSGGGFTLAEPAQPGAGSPPALPQEVPGYRILGELGRGGMGVVYRAEQLRLRRTVALKVALAGARCGPAQRARFVSEIEAAARLRHPQIVAVYEAGEHEGCPYYAMEYVEGVSLAEVLDGTPWRPDRAAGLVAELAGAIAHAHERGIVHRDLKPANVLIEGPNRGGDLVPEGRARIADFGLAKSLLSDSHVTQTGEILGTPSYMAPEQAGRRHDEVGPKADLYALGALFYELLTGRPPFRGATVVETLQQLQTVEPVSPRRLVPGLSRDVETIALKCLEKDPARRYDSAEALADDLRRLATGQPIQARPVGPAERARRWVRRHPGPAAILGGSAVLIVALVAASLETARYFERLAEDRESARKDAVSARAAESRARVVQSDLRRKADELRADVERERDRYRRGLYFAEMNLASRAWESRTGAGRAAELVEGWENPGERPDPRGWEWDYLAGATRSERVRIDRASQAVWSPDGRRLASRFESALMIWDREGGPPRQALRAGSSYLVSPSWSPDGRRIAATAQNGEAFVWDVQSGRLDRSLRAHEECGFDLAWSPDGRRIATAGRSPTAVRIWVEGSTDPEVTLPLSLSTAVERHRMLSWSPDGRRLAVAEPGGLVRVWEIPAGTPVLSFDPGSGQTIAVAYSPDGRRLLSLNERGDPRVWDAETGQPLASLKGHEGVVLAASWSPEGDRLATGGRDHSLIVWNVATSEPVAVLRGHTGPIFQVDWGAGDAGLASSNEYDETRLWGGLATDRDRILRGHGHYVSALAWSRDGRLAGGDWDNNAIVWDPATSRERSRMRTAFEIVRAVAFSPDGKTLALGGGNRPGETGIEIHEAESGRLVRRLGDGEWAHMLAWSDEPGRLIALCGGSAIWDVDAGRPVRVLSSERGQHFGALSRDGSRLAVAQLDGIRLLSLASDTPARHIPHIADVPSRAVRWSPDGRQIAAVARIGARAVIDILDTSTGERLTTLRGHTGMIYGLDWSPDASRIASCGADGEVKIWSPADGVEALTLRGHEGDVWSIAWSPEGAQLATGGTDRTIHIWDARRGRALRSGPDKSRPDFPERPRDVVEGASKPP